MLLREVESHGWTLPAQIERRTRRSISGAEPLISSLGERPVERNVIFTPDAPWSPGGSSQAISFNGVLYVSGQLPIDPATGQMLPRPFNALPGAADAQTRQCLKNVNAICQAAGADLSNAIKLTIHTPMLIEIGSVIDRVYREFFPVAPPARSMIGVNVLQGNALVQVDAIVPLTGGAR